MRQTCHRVCTSIGTRHSCTVSDCSSSSPPPRPPPSSSSSSRPNANMAWQPGEMCIYVCTHVCVYNSWWPRRTTSKQHARQPRPICTSFGPRRRVGPALQRLTTGYHLAAERPLGPLDLNCFPAIISRRPRMCQSHRRWSEQQRQSLGAEHLGLWYGRRGGKARTGQRATAHAQNGRNVSTMTT